MSLSLAKFPKQWIVKSACAFIFIIAAMIFSPIGVNHDAAWLLYLSREVAGGAEHYVDFVEVNPPLIIWLNLPVIFMAEWLNISLGFAFKLYVLALAALSVGLSAALLKRTELTTAPVLIVAMAFVLTILPGYQFGQREHFLMILVLPYLISAGVRLKGSDIPRGLAIVTAVLAGIGFCLKPHFVIVPMGIEILLLMRLGLKTTLRRPEPYAMMAVALAYLLAILTVSPNYISTITGDTGKMYVQEWAASDIFKKMVLNRRYVFFGILVGLGAFFTSGRKMKSVDPIFGAMFAGSILLLATYWLQFKGFPNHIYPTEAMLVVLLVCGYVYLSKREEKISKVFSYVILGTVFFLSLIPFILAQNYTPPDRSRFKELTANFSEDDSMFIMSAYISDGFPLVNELDVKWASRYPSLWFVAGTESPQSGADSVFDRQIIQSRQDMADDFAKHKPALVLVHTADKKRGFGDRQYDYIADFSQNADFAYEWSNYEFESSNGEYSTYLRKKDAP